PDGPPCHPPPASAPSAPAEAGEPFCRTPSASAWHCSRLTRSGGRSRGRRGREIHLVALSFFLLCRSSPAPVQRMRHIIGIDLGGTNIVAGCVAEDGSAIHGVRSVPTGA